MDSIDLFRRLTTNLSFDSVPQNLKRKSKESILVNSIESEQEHVEPTVLVSKKPKKVKNLFQINQEKINHLRNLYHINVNGNDIPNPVESLDQLYNESEFKKIFDDLHEHSKVLMENLSSYKFDELTPIQMQVIPSMLNVIFGE